ncbi:MAG: urea ABC transporter permease subunit UrtB [Rhodospirillaceae bacterium]|nr:urea ABC transporter permease subunit UrtB [Rhodospirillaceae bacterium]
MSVHDFWTPFALEPFISALIIGLSLASIWLVAALGLTIIYGTMGVINMAHGEFIMLGAYITWVLQYFLGFPWLLCLPISFVIVAFIGWLVERGLIRHLYDRPLDTLLATWGVSLVFIQSIRLIFGGEPQYIDTPEFLSNVVQIGFLNIPSMRIFIFGMALVLVGLTWALLYKSNFGIQVRSVMQNPQMAASFVINSSRVYGLTFAYGAGLAGISGSMFSGLKTIFPDMGLGYVVEAFLVVVTGGGELFGSLATAGIMGEMFSVFSYFTNDTFARFVLFVLIVIFLRFRPQGIFTPSMARR